MKRIPIDEPELKIEDLLQKMEGDGALLTRGGVVSHALVPMEEDEWERYSLAKNHEFMDLIESSRKRYAREGGISLEEAFRETNSQ